MSARPRPAQGRPRPTASVAGLDALDLRALHGADVLAPLDVQLACKLGELAGERDARVLLALALTSRQVRGGHVCLDLPALCAGRVAFDIGAQVLPAWPALPDWLAALRASPLVGDETAFTPLYVDSRGRVYLRRHYDHERSVARLLAARATAEAPALDARVLDAGLQRLFPVVSAAPSAATGSKRNATKGERRDTQRQLGLFDEPAAPAQPAALEPDYQRLAAERALRSRLTVVSGGPGTGKTATVVKILALLVEQAFARGEPAPRVLLLAPTGKAAARLVESVQKAKSSLRCEPEVREAIAQQASTLHRALGLRVEDGRAFRAAPSEPLLADVVVVDEASMVDLALMARLLERVPSQARLILLGDRDQLASVEAGAVLGDVCGAGLPAAAKAEPAPPIARCIVQLTRSYRYREDSGIRDLAQAIRAGDVEGALRVLRDASRPDVSWVEPTPSRSEGAGELDPELVRLALQGFSPLFASHDPLERLSCLDRFRILCAHRRGPLGVVDVNERVERALRHAGHVSSRSPRYDGRPILITANDPDAQLYNGDLGVLCTAKHDAARLVACFPRVADGAMGTRSLSVARLPPHESVYAMSVHKSQGSETDEVAVVLPREPSPLLSRELLYTAVTRARKRVVIFGPEPCVALAVRTAVERASGLREALWMSSDR